MLRKVIVPIPEFLLRVSPLVVVVPTAILRSRLVIRWPVVPCLIVAMSRVLAAVHRVGKHDRVGVVAARSEDGHCECLGVLRVDRVVELVVLDLNDRVGAGSPYKVELDKEEKDPETAHEAEVGITKGLAENVGLLLERVDCRLGSVGRVVKVCSLE